MKMEYLNSEYLGKEYDFEGNSMVCIRVLHPGLLLFIGTLFQECIVLSEEKLLSYLSSRV